MNKDPFVTKNGSVVTYGDIHKPRKHNIGGWLILVLIVGVTVWQFVGNKPAKPECANPQIKGNINYTTGEKIYHVPGDPYYNRTQIDTSQGERWFCTVKDAQAAGWRASGN